MLIIQAQVRSLLLTTMEIRARNLLYDPSLLVSGLCKIGIRLCVAELECDENSKGKIYKINMHG